MAIVDTTEALKALVGELARAPYIALTPGSGENVNAELKRAAIRLAKDLGKEMNIAVEIDKRI